MQTRFLFIIFLSVVILSCGVKKPPLPPIREKTTMDEKEMSSRLKKDKKGKKGKKGKKIKVSEPAEGDEDQEQDQDRSGTDGQN